MDSTDSSTLSLLILLSLGLGGMSTSGLVSGDPGSVERDRFFGVEILFGLLKSPEESARSRMTWTRTYMKYSWDLVNVPTAGPVMVRLD